MHANAFTRYSSYAGTIYNYSDSEIINNAYTVKTERYEVSDYSYSDGKATFKVSLGYKEMNTDSKILVAAYSADNTMLSCKVYDYDYVIYPTLEAEENSKIEVFWLDSFGNLKPIIESVSAH